MSSHHRPISASQQLVGRIALLLVVIALIVNVAAFAWLRPYSILRDLGELAQARELILTSFVDEVDNQKLIDSALHGMADGLGDAHTQYFSAEEYASFREQFGGQFEGIGAEIDIHEDRLRIVTPMDDSPAWKSGVMPGDIVYEIDGFDTLGIDLYDAIKRIKGKAGTQVRLKVQHRDGAFRDITVTRDKIDVATVRGYRRIPGNGYDYFIDPQQKIAYVRLTQFGENSHDDMARTLEKLKGEGMKTLIFDLRDNPGGLLDGAIKISDLFLTEGKTIVSTRGRDQAGETAISSVRTLLPDTPLVVLINENSASASEVVSGAMLDNQRALLVGTRSYGKGSVQQLIDLGEGYQAIKLTTAHWYMPSGRLIHKQPGATQWGVDPSPGCYVPMDETKVRQMLIKRRDAESDDPYARLSGPVTPQWIRETLLDDQLAAALDAANGMLATGTWPKVGVDQEQALAQPTEKDRLTRRRDELQELLEQVNEQLKALEPAQKP